MERSTMLCGLVALCALLAAATPATAEWAPDGVLLISSSIDETDYWRHVQFGFVSDGQGGAIVYWIENREATGDDILAQRIDARGNLLWTQGGVAVCEAAGDQTSPWALADGAGGAIFLWNDSRGEDSDIYAQRLDAGGNPAWAVDGAAIRADEGSQTIAGAIPNGTGEAIVVWHDRPDVGGEYTTSAQLIDSNAGVLWTAEDIVVRATSDYQLYMRIISDGAGGAIIAWKDCENINIGPVDILVQRLDSNGARRWPANGIQIAGDVGFLSTMRIQSDGSGGAVILWEDREDGISRIQAQRVLPNGAPYWAEGGVPLCASPEADQVQASMVPDGSGGAIVFLTTALGRSDILAQRIDASGNLVWAANGIAVCDTPNEQQIPAAIPDGSGGAIVTWTDYPPGDPLGANVYAQHLTAEGALLWPSAGLTVCAAAGQQAYTRCATDGEGGAIAAWEDTRSGTKAAYAQRIDRNGNWGYPAPSIAAVRDVPGDQGGFANLSWLASRLDAWPGHAVSSYSVWRAISPEQAAQALKSGGATLSDDADFGSGPAKPLVRIERTASRTFYWSYVSTVPAAHLDGYAEAVPTLFDSTAVCGEQHYFQVIAHGSDPGMYWISAPDSGRSVDNLAPAPPAALAGAPAESAAGLRLVWNSCREADLDHYAVYRGPAEGFEPSPGNRIAGLADTMYLDGEWRAGDRHYYKVLAVDIHGNESRCSLLRPEDIAGGETRETPAATYLAQNFPNPFNPSTRIVFGLKTPEFASLRIYDAAGRLVRALVDRELAAGAHEALWNGRDDRGALVSSGLYFCRLRAGSFTSLRKMVLLK